MTTIKITELSDIGANLTTSTVVPVVNMAGTPVTQKTNIGNIANITGNLRVDGIIQSNGNVTSNAFINGNNASFTNFANIGGNLLANNITSNALLTTANANISSNLVTNNATVNLELSGNTANFSGNVIVPKFITFSVPCGVNTTLANSPS